MPPTPLAELALTIVRYLEKNRIIIISISCRANKNIARRHNYMFDCFGSSDKKKGAGEWTSDEIYTQEDSDKIIGLTKETSRHLAPAMGIAIKTMTQAWKLTKAY